MTSSSFQDRLSTTCRRFLEPTLVGLAVLLALVGVFLFVRHLQTDPLVDIHAYYEAGERLNAGLPLYAAQGDVNSPHYYFYPPLLAIVFRPLALLPFQVAAIAWEIAMVAAFGVTLRLVGLRSRRTWIAVGLLGGPIAWSITIGQAQVGVTLLLALGNPAAVALATQVKLFPALVALYWIGRRDWNSLGRYIGWSALLVLVQLILEPTGSLAFVSSTNLGLVGQVNNLSPYAISPLLWLALVVGGTALALRLAPTRFGWAASVAVSSLASPRLLGYALMTLLAGVHEPSGGREHASGDASMAKPPPDTQARKAIPDGTSQSR